MKYLCLCFLLILSSCVVQDLLDPPSLKESYFRSLGDLNKERWLSLEEVAINDSTEIDLPYKELFTIDTSFSASAGYIINCKSGEVLHVESDDPSIFVEVYPFVSDSVQSNKSLFETEVHQKEHVIEIPRTGKYFVRFQPKLELSTDIILSIFTSPVYSFPVAGGKRADIGSFWGDPRDGGKRKHKGVDIFAKKGTPLVAVSDGRINSARNSGLGGKQIWLNDRSRNQTVYYAHLDSQYVSKGDRVLRGDTIGTVGNTGNARTTPPHLHFAIYKYQKGAVDPINHILESKLKFTTPNAPTIFSGSIVEVKVSNANFRGKPEGKSAILRKLQAGNLLRVIGVSGNWYHLRTSDGTSGFLYKSSIVYPSEPT